MILQLGLQALESNCVKLFEFGEQKRDFVYIDDVVAANVLAMSAQKGGVYNVGFGVSRSFNDIIAILRKELGALSKRENLAPLGDFELEYIKNPYTFFQTHTQADISLSTQDLGYTPAYSLEEGIKDYIQAIYTLSQTKGLLC